MRPIPLVPLATEWLIIRTAEGQYVGEAFGGFRIGKGSRSTWKPAALPPCSPHIPHYLKWDRTLRHVAEPSVSAVALPCEKLAQSRLRWRTFVAQLQFCTKWQGVLDLLNVCQAYEPWRLTVITASWTTSATVRCPRPTF
jgi:hypothetical protein